MPKGTPGDKSYPVRCIKAHHSSYLLNNMKAFDFDKRSYNVYHSIFTLKNMPMFSYSPLARKTQQNQFFLDYDSYVTGVDFVIDIDGMGGLSDKENMGFAREATIKICAFFNDKNIPYALVFSGTKGFHIEIRRLPPTLGKHQERLADYRKLILMLGRKLKIKVRETADDIGLIDATIYTTTRIWKSPYNYDVKTGLITYPITDAQLLCFDETNLKAERLINVNHFGRGLQERKGDRENLFKLMQEWGVTDG